MKWTAEQNQFLADNASKGAEWCTKEMFKEFGVMRTTNSVWRQSNRLGISMRKYEVCPSCGREVVSLAIQSGLCKECHSQYLADWSRNVREVVELSIQGKENMKEYEKNRKWLQRHYEDFMNLSKKMSNRRSGQEKKLGEE